MSKIHGIDEFLKAIDNVVPELQAKTEKAFAKIGNAVEGAAKRYAPTSGGIKGSRGGELRQSITHEVTRDGQNVIGAVGTNVKYAAFVELGTERIINANNAKTVPIEAISKGKYDWDRGLDPENPITSWAALKGRGGSGQSMPFLRRAIISNRSAIEKELKDIGK